MSDDVQPDEEQPIPGRCGARTKSGGLCRGYPVPPVEVEGEWLVPTRCKYHGGSQQAMRRDDPRLGGAPVRTGLGLRIGERITARARVAESEANIEAYGRHLTDSEMLATYVSPEFRLGTLDADIKLARSYLVDAMRNQQANPHGGAMVQRGTVTKIRLHRDVVAELLDLIRRMESTRAKLAKSAEPGADDLKGHEAWLRATKTANGRRSKSRSGRRSSSHSSSDAPSDSPPGSDTP